jgi:MFS family permease
MIDHLNRISHHNGRVLTTAQALGGASPAIVVSLGGLVGQQLSTNPALSTLPISVFNLGMAIGTLPAAYIMKRFGRRAGYTAGAILGTIGGLVAAGGIYKEIFYLFCIGTLIAGFYASYVQSYRFAVTDGAPDAIKPRLISWVMLGGLGAAIIGPQTVIWTRDVFVTAPFAGSFVAQSVLAFLALPVIWFLRKPPEPKITIKSTATQTHQSAESDQPLPPRSLKEIAKQPKFIVAVTSGVVSYSLMSFVMTAAPIAMVGCGHTVGEAALGIQWHVLAMFAPSFVTGRLIQRFGTTAVTSLGLILLALSAVVGLSGLGLTHFWLALVLLGVGWNFGFVGATTMVTACHRPNERNKVQALNDFLVFGSVAASSFSAGKLLSVAGWETLNYWVFPGVAIVFALMAWQKFATRHHNVEPA